MVKCFELGSKEILNYIESWDNRIFFLFRKEFIGLELESEIYLRPIKYLVTTAFI